MSARITAWELITATFNEWLEDRRARRMVIDRYIAGWITAEFALETLIGLGLIEFTPSLLDERANG